MPERFATLGSPGVHPPAPRGQDGDGTTGHAGGSDVIPMADIVARITLQYSYR